MDAALSTSSTAGVVIDREGGSDLAIPLAVCCGLGLFSQFADSPSIREFIVLTHNGLQHWATAIPSISHLPWLPVRFAEVPSNLVGEGSRQEGSNLISRCDAGRFG